MSTLEQRNIVLGKIIIEKDAFIGTNAVVHPNVTIGEGAVIGSNSLVLKDIEPRSINVGSPCKKVGESEGCGGGCVRMKAGGITFT